GFTPKTPLLTQRGFSLGAGNIGSAGRWPAGALMKPPRTAAPTKVGDYRWQSANQGWHAPMAERPKKAAPRGAPL
ncbi:hypothetical protein, partial [Stenotrophomonas maltophilia]|uniref:hypothetical protein n=1 Tax=Stenotrophomonas maltophilia TaxID=40324 RepID=UPI001955945F